MKVITELMVGTLTGRGPRLPEGEGNPFPSLQQTEGALLIAINIRATTLDAMLPTVPANQTKYIIYIRKKIKIKNNFFFK